MTDHDLEASPVLDGEQELTIMPDDEQERQYPLATVKARVGAFLVDLMIIGVINSLLMTYDGLQSWEMAISVNALFLGLTASIYFIFFTYYKGQTPGKMLLKIKVVRRDGQDLDWKTVMIRELFGKIVSQLRFFYLGYLYCLVSKTNQCWHDLFADTYVISLSKKEKFHHIVLEK